MSEYGHNTQDELDFLKGIGTYRENGVPLEKKVLLKNYISSMKIRDNWMDLDKNVIIYYAKELLDIEIQKN